MSKDKGCTSVFLGLLLYALPGVAAAHTGAGETSGFAAGFGHPLGGVDHVLAMVAVGLWAAQMGGRAVWAVPGAFVTLMIAGGALGLLGLSVPLVEAGIVASLLVLGVFVAKVQCLPLAWSAGLVGAFALFHGYAHGAEIPGAISAWSYTAGFGFATAGLHGLGVITCALLRRCGLGRATRVAGGAVALGGVWLAMI